MRTATKIADNSGGGVFSPTATVIFLVGFVANPTLLATYLGPNKVWTAHSKDCLGCGTTEDNITIKRYVAIEYPEGKVNLGYMLVTVFH